MQKDFQSRRGAAHMKPQNKAHDVSMSGILDDVLLLEQTAHKLMQQVAMLQYFGLKKSSRHIFLAQQEIRQLAIKLRTKQKKTPKLRRSY
jgi:hypothetical protein